MLFKRLHFLRFCYILFQKRLIKLRLNYNFLSEKGDFDYSHSTDLHPNESEFELHTHNYLQIIVFLKGNCEFRAEGTTYEVNPNDILITHSTEMHVMLQKNPQEPYERAVFHIRKSFFYENNCEEFLELFLKRPLGVNNLIPAKLGAERNIPGIIKDIDMYIRENDGMLYTALKSKLCELLYNLNRIVSKSDETTLNNDKIKDIIYFINDNIKNELSLDKLSDHFYISKYHLCHIFKEHSGLTINKYINRKRILLVRELAMSGWSLIDASMEAGFGNYSNFYKVYVKETGVSPKKDLK